MSDAEGCRLPGETSTRCLLWQTKSKAAAKRCPLSTTLRHLAWEWPEDTTKDGNRLAAHVATGLDTLALALEVRSCKTVETF